MDSCVAHNCSSPISGTTPVVFTQLIQTLIAAQCSLGKIEDYPPDRTWEIMKNVEESFDFIIVGGGSAGSVLAARLSEQSDWKVLLIEAGTYPSAISSVPSQYNELWGSKEDYRYQHEPQRDFCLGMVNKRCLWSGGKVLGGGSTINGMIYIYGNKRDFDNWEAEGNEGWGYEDVLPYFKKSNNYPRETIDKYGDKYLGRDGPLSVRLFNYSSSIFHEVVIKAAEEKGIPRVDIFNTDQYIGFGKLHMTADKGRRVSAATAYLSPIKNRKNLYVMTSTRADEILIKDNRATGVRVLVNNGSTIELKASKEVILSAGAIGSPKLLMLSGIGPKEDLEKFKIQCKADLPVGKYLKDHVVWHGIFLEFVNQSHARNNLFDSQDDAYQYLTRNEGALTGLDELDFSGFINVQDPSSIYPDIQFLHAYVSQDDNSTLARTLDRFGLSPETRDSIVNSTKKNDIFFMSPFLLRPKSIGEVKLRSKSPADSVRLFQRHLTDKSDIETLLKSVDFVKRLLDTEAFKNFGVKIRNITIPGCDKFEFDSSGYWECFIRHTAFSGFHSVGTVRMGTPENPKTVVDFKLKVLGIDQLRVIDASIMPEVTSGNINAPTMMIAEKGADLIKEFWIKTKKF
ncbi:glucose dehydrogenase [FAD, quinone] [Microplitis demolitor]|uniref:glucose dehydrogenase [FAD, quinone] n=1 Tax=Microplitis demolitor TaxID=69319 RepID=UPI00043FFE2E|nr:glucose dehydrogenase [FAD, quinone] [Microplitis demolitor]